MPILKSTSRKTPDFRQLVDYVVNKKSEYGNWIALHNMDSSIESKDEIIDEFYKNDSFRKKRKNGVAIYHSALSFSPEDRQILSEAPWILENIAYEYLNHRTNGIGIGYSHWDKDSPHIHFILSANEYRSAKSIRLSKTDFANLKKHLEAYIIKEYPEIRYSTIEHKFVKESSEINLEL